MRQRLDDLGDRSLEAFFDDTARERAFVKNLERVQGDERDAIILTIGYGRGADGQLRYRFGPLLAEGGERRLNVAITRARRRLTLVSSFTHADITRGGPQPPGSRCCAATCGTSSQAGGTSTRWRSTGPSIR